MIGNVENVIKWLQINDLKYWRVKVKEGDNATVFESADGVGFDDNVSKFRNVMDISQGNRYTITASREKAQSKGNYFEEFKNLETYQQNTNSQPNNAISGVPADEVEKKINEAIEKYKNQVKTEILEAEVIELRKAVRESDTAFNRVVTKLEPYIGTIAGALMNKFIPPAPQLGIAGLEDVTDVEDETETVPTVGTTEDASRLEIALETWAKADPDFIDIIETVARLASTGNPMYQTAKGLLKTM